MKVELVSPRDDLVSAIASRIQPVGKDYSKNWIVFPEKRPTYYLRKALAVKEKSSFIPPLLDSIDSFIDRVFAERLGLQGRPINELDAIAILFEIQRNAPHRLGQDHFISADNFFSLGVKLFNDLEELHAAAACREDILKLDQWADEAVPKESVIRLQSLSFFYERFYETLQAQGLSTQSSRFRQVADRIRAEQFPDIDQFIFAGFFSLTKTETNLLKVIMGWDHSSLFLVKGKGLESLLEKLSIDDESIRREIPLRGPGPALTFTKSADTHGQLFTLNQLLKDKLRDRTLLNEKQVIVLPASETLFPLYQQTLSAWSEEDFNISLGYPLVRTPIFSFFEKLFEVLQSRDEAGRIYVPNYLRFVLHPYTKNIYFPGSEKRADLTRILFHSLEEELTFRKAKSFWSLEEIENDPGIREAIQDRIGNLEDAPTITAFLEHLRFIHNQTLTLFEEIRNVGDFAEKLVRVLNFIYEKSTARLHYFFHPYAEAFLAQLDALARSLLRAVVFEENDSYFNLFRKIIAAGSVPFYGTPLRGLQVLGFWETRCIPFEEVYILDMNEGTLPSYSRADSLLPFPVRKSLGLPTYQDHERRMEYYLETLIQGAQKVCLFFVENPDKERSRFIENLIWEKQKRERQPRSDKYLQTVQYNVALQTEKPRPIPKTPEVVEFLREYPYSASSLDSYLSCPLRFYYANVLNIREKEEITRRMEKKDIGTFVHILLENYFRKFIGRRMIAEELSTDEMDAHVDRLFKTEFGGDEAGSAFLMKLQIRRHLGEFITDYQVPVIRALQEQKKELHLLSLEQRLNIIRVIAGVKFRLGARVDRTEIRAGELYILDYKTTANEKYFGINFAKLDLEDRATWNQAVRSLQLSVYNLILSLIHRKPREHIHCLFLMLGKNRLSPGIEFSPYDEEDENMRCEQIRTMEEFIERLLSEIIDPQVPFDPGMKSADSCNFCRYVHICNKQ